jgi:hypothetical protein
MENAIEVNVPTGFSLCGVGILPPSFCCRAEDNIWKNYFNKGIFSEKGCFRMVKYYHGTPSLETARRFECVAAWNAAHGLINFLSVADLI